MDTPRATPVEELAAALLDGTPPHRLLVDFAGAFAAAKEKGLAVLVAGSLFLVGDARAVLTGGTFQRCTQ